MKAELKVFVIIVIQALAMSCGSDNPHWWGPPGGRGGPGCGMSVGGYGYSPDEIHGSFPIFKEPDYLSGGYYAPISPIVSTQGWIDLHTMVLPGAYDSLTIQGCLTIDPRAFFTNFFYEDPFGFGSVGPVMGNQVGIPFSSTMPAYLSRPYADWQSVVLEGEAITGPLPMVGTGPGFTQYGYPGVPQQQSLILNFTSNPMPLNAPVFAGGRVVLEGAFEIYYGSGYGSYQYGGYPYSGAGAIQRTLWTIRQ